MAAGRSRTSWIFVWPTTEALMTARDIAGFMKVQQKWGLQAVPDYADEATRLSRMLTTFSLTGTTPAVQQAARLVA